VAVTSLPHQSSSSTAWYEQTSTQCLRDPTAEQHTASWMEDNDDSASWDSVPDWLLL